ncbi:zinc finger protein 391 isoform X2 [Canis lupus familiaris]|uniref:zinc finger protein 391 isoform X2 n=1 Tax=Canis lupus familiaris TaxID=9615 RepID=UPI000BAA22AF|nr:zinc finger protein 391 isoform X2 [Canis lupus familiaris]XP_035566520.1 zinc finger protein 391 isoform X2 [Canis lupus dingo]XP_038302522.1 zinc finger protein 391 isoform X2 [Canis lupus familiaris]XP_038440327.1 zinc finger protein 391 isoform X2 [Canis lupus familiaris]|eukprot:XP_022270307.1 zinc finger protein 391 isoform X2 [Canis lupus familiaris]
MLFQSLFPPISVDICLSEAAHWPQAKREVPGELARWKEAWTHGTWGTDWPCRPELWACTYPPVCAASSCRLRSRQPQAPRCLGPQSEVVVCGCSVNEPGAPGDRWPRGHHDQASFHHVAPAAPLCAFFTSKRLLSVNCTGWRKKELRVLSPHRVSLNKLNTTTTLHQDELHPKPWHPVTSGTRTGVSHSTRPLVFSIVGSPLEMRRPFTQVQKLHCCGRALPCILRSLLSAGFHISTVGAL